jgi:hypothetical protein
MVVAWEVEFTDEFSSPMNSRIGGTRSLKSSRTMWRIQ